MEQFAKNTIFKSLLKYAPITLLFISVLNEFDFNYLELKYFSFNFPNTKNSIEKVIKAINEKRC